ncbi:TadE family protein [Celeribacter arenosi]|uniref:Flp pilus assembly protein TadG n=1 Tax=Celeribacter arenosi TaxID=792649 RepID=A0ABP7KF08_9RHOB
MFNRLGKLKRTVRTFFKGDDGSATIEHVLWIPVLGGLVMLSTDATLLLHEQTYLYELSRDAARMVSVGQKTVEEAKIATETRLGSGAGYEVNVVINEEYVVASIDVPFEDIILFNGPFVGNAKLNGGVTMWIEGVGSDETDPEETT